MRSGIFPDLGSEDRVKLPVSIWKHMISRNYLIPAYADTSTTGSRNNSRELIWNDNHACICSRANEMELYIRV